MRSFSDVKEVMNNKHTGKTKKVFDQKTFPKKGTEPQKAGDGTRHSRAKSKDIKQETPDIISTLFNTIPAETTKYLADFGTIVQDVLPLSGKQRKDLPHTIKDLSRQLTDERSRRRAGYMNETAQLSAYIRYFMWW
ncbi:MAG: hypothetical protein LBU99_03165, partial [Spirochaetaceae bacterium]|nr:hypothetical protein [Spirochaetaceae bacterium]